jgi:DNA-binding NtrC family response regulator
MESIVTGLATAILRGLRSIGPAKRGATATLAPQPRQLSPITPILLVSALESDRSSMQELLKGTKYVPANATNWHRAGRFLSHMVFPVVVYDRLSDIADWQLSVRRIARSCGSPSVLLLSQTRDNELHDSLIASGGFDILVRPLGIDALQILDRATAHFALSTLRPQPAKSSGVDFPALRQDQPGGDPGFPFLTRPLSRSEGI